jgi:hypothetical protein
LLANGQGVVGFAATLAFKEWLFSPGWLQFTGPFEMVVELLR